MDTTRLVLSKADLLTLAAAQIAAALIAALPKTGPESMMNKVPETAVKMAKAIDQAVVKVTNFSESPRTTPETPVRVHP
jgi:hypothetical protein